MNTILKFFTHLVFACGLLVFAITPSNKYTWMQDLDPSMTSLPVDDTAGNRTILTLVFLVVMVAAQLVIVFTAHSKGEKRISLGLIAVAISAWCLACWQ